MLEAEVEFHFIYVFFFFCRWNSRRSLIESESFKKLEHLKAMLQLKIDACIWKFLIFTSFICLNILHRNSTVFHLQTRVGF